MHISIVNDKVRICFGDTADAKAEAKAFAILHSAYEHWVKSNWEVQGPLTLLAPAHAQGAFLPSREAMEVARFHAQVSHQAAVEKNMTALLAAIDGLKTEIRNATVRSLGNSNP